MSRFRGKIPYSLGKITQTIALTIFKLGSVNASNVQINNFNNYINLNASMQTFA